MSKPLHYLGIAESAELIASRQLSPVELTEASIARAEATNDRLHAYVLPTWERARADAKKAESEIAAGRYLGPLHGIPLGVKDIYFTKGIRTTCHSHLLMENVPTIDSRVNEKLSAAGMVMMGKLATHEFAFGGPSFDLPFPPARNPWNTDHFTGGSSSGSGAAVAAGLVPAALGSDTGGSIRLPASFCGLAGIKPTYGRVSRTGIAPLSQALDHAGPMCWTVEDCALMLQAMAGHDAADPGCADLPVPDYRAALTGDIKGLRIGVIRSFYADRASDSAKTAMDEAIGVLAGLGAEITEVGGLSPLIDYHACTFILMLIEAYAIHEKDLRESPDKYGEFLRDRLMLSSFLTGADYMAGNKLRRQLCGEIAGALEDCDVLLTASAFDAAPPITVPGKFDMFHTPNLTSPFNATGSPALSLCNGYNAAGLPLGMQIVGKPFDEATVFRVGHAYEKATPWRDRRPDI